MDGCERQGDVAVADDAGAAQLLGGGFVDPALLP